jgi:hypothetical protein
MAKITFGPTINDARGKTGDTVFTRSRGGAVARALKLAAAGVGPHDLLSLTHTDTTPATPPARGSIISAQGLAPRWTELTIGDPDQILTSDGTDANWTDPAPPSVVPISLGGTGQTTKAPAFDALSPASARGDLITRNASTNVPLPIGTNGQLLSSNGTDVFWMDPPTPHNVPITTIASGDKTASINATPSVIHWPTANLAFFIPFPIPEPITITRIMFCSSNTGANYDVGIYDVFGNRLVSYGSHAKGTTAQCVVADIANTALPAGNYYVALVFDNNTGDLQIWQPFAGWNELIGIRQMAAAFPLPNPAVYADSTTANYHPLISLDTKA